MNFDSSVDSLSTELVELSHRIHSLAEIGFEERESAAAIAEMLEQRGFAIDRGIAELPTAFKASLGTGALHIGLIAEYDALPGVGHACGHNIIASASVGAALALAGCADELDITVSVFGTPAEEGGGGKIFMLQRGVFDGVHAALMVHPASIERDAMSTLATAQLEVEFKGKASHAAAAPERGISASAAIALAQSGIAFLREHLTSDQRIHGIVTNGGTAPNVVPERTTGRWFVRANTIDSKNHLEQRVLDVFRGAAQMTGCELSIRKVAPSFSDLRSNSQLQDIWRSCAAELGRESLAIQPDDGLASTDMGNVSYAIPSIHPLIALDTSGANIHEAEFARFAAEETGDKAVIDGAKLLANTVKRAAENTELRKSLISNTYAVTDAGDAPYLDWHWSDTLH
jgi:amidohydrolase